MYEKFTDQARKAMQLANQETQRFNREYIGTEDILIGLVKEGSGGAANILKNLEVDLVKIYSAVEQTALNGPYEVTMRELATTPRDELVVEYAVEEAKSLGHEDIGTEHLLLGLLRDAEGAAAHVLISLGLNLDDVRKEILKLLGCVLEEERTEIDADGTTKDDDEASLAPESKQSRTPTLDSFGRDLTELAGQGKLDPVIGLQREIERVVEVLCRRDSFNPLLIGEQDSELTVIGEALAQLIVHKNIPELLVDRRLIELDLARMTVTRPREEFEQRISNLLGEVRRARNTILFIHNLSAHLSPTEPAAASGAALLGLALSRGELQCIGTTTKDNYHLVLRDPALTRQFQTIPVVPLTPDATIELVKGLRERYEAHHCVQITDDAIDRAVRLTEIFLPDQVLPGKARNLIDEASTRVRLKAMRRPPDVPELDELIERLNMEKEEAVANQDFEKAASLRDQADKLKKKKEDLTRQWREQVRYAGGVVDEEEVISALSRLTGYPVEAIRAEDTSALPLPPATPQAGVPEYERMQCSSILQGQGIEIQQNTGLVLMPFRDEFEKILEAVIRPAMQEAGVATQVASEIFQPGPIVSQVWDCIRSAEVIIADASGQNPNVMFELGLCFAAYRFPIVLVRSSDDLPVNLQALRHIIYEDTAEGLEKLKSELLATIRAFLSAARKRSPVTPPAQ